MDGYTCVCVDMYTHTYTYRHTHPCICHTCMHARTHTYTHRRRPRQGQPRSSCLRERAYDGRFGILRARGGRSGPDLRSSGSERVRVCWRCPFDLITCLWVLVVFAGMARAWVLLLIAGHRGQPSHIHAHACNLRPSLSPPPLLLSPSLSQVLVAVQRRQADQEARGTGSAAAGACAGGAVLDAEVRYGLMRLVRGLAGDKEVAVGFEEALAEAWRALWGEIHLCCVRAHVRTCIHALLSEAWRTL